VIAASSSVVPIVVAIAVIVVFAAAFGTIAVTWDKIPWWRQHPKPSRAFRDDKDRVKDWKLRKRYPDAFKGYPPFQAKPSATLPKEPKETP
jgi:hypothetical protein